MPKTLRGSSAPARNRSTIARSKIIWLTVAATDHVSRLPRTRRRERPQPAFIRSSRPDHPGHSPLKWTHDYRSVLPYIRDAFEKSLEEIQTSIPAEVRGEVVNILRYLCEPDPKLRGHPSDIGGHQFNLERVVSAFNLIATKAEHGLVKA